jgi:hypothetical protein
MKEGFNFASLLEKIQQIQVFNHLFWHLEDLWCPVTTGDSESFANEDVDIKDPRDHQDCKLPVITIQYPWPYQ